MNPLLLVDSYKIHHNRMYPDNMSKLYSNLTPRKSRLKGVNGIVVFGIQHFILKYLIEAFDLEFFGKQFISVPDEREQYPARMVKGYKDKIIEEYKRHCPVDTKHIEDLWDLGYLPLEIKALPEGSICPIGVPCLTVTNTDPRFGWLVNYLETLLSCVLWQPITSATIAHEYKKLLDRYAKETTGSTEGVQWQGHDFSMRGMPSPDAAITSGMGHLLSFTGTDTIPAIYQLEKSYNATGLIGASVPATEHSVMCMGTKEDEIETFTRLLDLYPTGILSVVSDTWDLWKVLTEYLPVLKEQILSRNGKLVIRPDSGDPVDIICGHPVSNQMKFEEYKSVKGGKLEWSENEYKGVIELLWDVFGGTINDQGYKVLDSHIGAIYGDSITLVRAEQICERLKAKGFASTNIVLGIGSMTYTGGETSTGNQYWITRDLFGFAMKATYGELAHGADADGTPIPNAPKMPEFLEKQGFNDWYVEAREIFKDPITDDGTKKSAKGLLCVNKDQEDGPYKLVDRVTWEGEKKGYLETVFLDGKLVNPTTLEQIRERLNK